MNPDWPGCLKCRHWDGRSACKAFPVPKGVPLAIASGQHDHRKPFPGDNGVRFEPKRETPRCDSTSPPAPTASPAGR